MAATRPKNPKPLSEAQDGRTDTAIAQDFRQQEEKYCFEQFFCYAKDNYIHTYKKNFIYFTGITRRPLDSPKPQGSYQPDLKYKSYPTIYRICPFLLLKISEIIAALFLAPTRNLPKFCLLGM